MLDILRPYHVPSLAALFRQLLRFEYAADQTLRHFFKQNPKMGKKERELYAELSFGMLRHLGTWRFFLETRPTHLSHDKALVYLACIHVLFHDTQTMQTRCDALAKRNFFLEGEKALLHQLIDFMQKTQDGVDDVAYPPHIRYSVPYWLWESLLVQYQDAEARQILASMFNRASLDIRVNRLKTDTATLQNRLLEHHIHAQTIPELAQALRLKTRISVQHLPEFMDGHFEIQDAASQILLEVIKAKRGDMVMDFCAGAGGKTLALGAQMDGKGRIYAIDVHDKRLEQLKIRLKRSGLQNVYSMCIQNEHDARLKKLQKKMDKVLVDVPCSGFGTLRRNPDLKWRHTHEAIAQLNQLQYSILTRASTLVKPGGRLIYATCSILRQENEAIVEAFLQQFPQFRLVPVHSIVQPSCWYASSSPYLKLLPHTHQTDGFFAAVLEYTDEKF